MKSRETIAVEGTVGQREIEERRQQRKSLSVHVLILTVASVMKQGRKFTVVIERDEDGYYVASVPTLRGCHTQAKTLDTLMKRVREAIEVCLDGNGDRSGSLELVGIQQISL